MIALLIDKEVMVIQALLDGLIDDVSFVHESSKGFYELIKTCSSGL